MTSICKGPPTFHKPPQKSAPQPKGCSQPLDRAMPVTGRFSDQAPPVPAMPAGRGPDPHSSAAGESSHGIPGRRISCKDPLTFASGWPDAGGVFLPSGHFFTWTLSPSKVYRFAMRSSSFSSYSRAAAARSQNRRNQTVEADKKQSQQHQTTCGKRR